MSDILSEALYIFIELVYIISFYVQ